MVGASRLALTENIEHPKNPPPLWHVLVHLILLQHLEMPIQTRDRLFWQQVTGYEAGGLGVAVGMDDNKHEAVPCVHVGGEDTCIVEDSRLGHLAACDAVPVREVEDMDNLRLVNGDGTPDASDEQHKQEEEAGVVDQKLLGCKAQ